METYLSLLWAALPASIVIAAAIAIIVYLKRRKGNAHDSINTASADKASAKGLTDKVKKAVAEKPPWLMTLAVAGGWLFFLFSVFVFFPDSAWQWLLAHKEFLWMPPLVAIIAQILYSLKKKPADYLARAIIAVLFFAFFAAIPWGGSGNGGANTTFTPPSATARNAAISTPLSWSGCEPLPGREPTRIGGMVSQTLYAPVGAESRCYIIRDGYRSRMAPQTPLRMRWQNGTILNLSPDPTKMTDLGTVWYAAFVISSEYERPAKLIMRFEKYAQ